MNSTTSSPESLKENRPTASHRQNGNVSRDPARKLPTLVQRILPQDPGRRLMVRQLWLSRKLFVLTLVTSILSASLEGFGIGLLIPFLEGLLNTGEEPFRTGISFVDVNLLAVEASQLERLYRASALLFAVVWLRVLFGYLGHFYSIKMRENILDRIRREIVDQIQSVSLSFFSEKRSGNIINTLTTEVKRLQTLFSVAKVLFILSLMLVAYGIALIWLSWQLTVLALAFCSFLVLMLNGFLRRLRDNGRKIAGSNANLMSSATELLSGIRTIMEFGTQKREAHKFAHHSRSLRDVITSTAIKGAAVQPLTTGISFTGLLAIIILTVQFFIVPGYLSTVAFLAFMFVLMRILPILKSINTQRAQWSLYRGALDDVTALLDSKDKPYLPDGSQHFDEFTDQIALRNVSFGYEPGQEVIKDVSFDIHRGQTVAIVGGSGAGKSTLVDLIARLYDPNDGQILIDGTDLRDYKLASLRARMAIVNQSTFLFNTTVWDNIAYGTSEEDVSPERIRQAAAEANALEFIEELPDGFDTILGERGARLSGGQRQRIAIARALLRNPDILILDEATSALDSASEQLVQSSLDILMENRTVIVIAHRLSTIENADHVIVLENGEIVEQGTYNELVASDGQLSKYHNLQFKPA